MRQQQLNTFWAAPNTPASCASTIFKHTKKPLHYCNGFYNFDKSHSTVELTTHQSSKISHDKSQPLGMNILSYGRRIHHRYV